MNKTHRACLVASMALMAAVPAFAHEGHDHAGVLAGFSHPLLGPDHVIAMLAVGLWAAFAGRPGTWVLPLIFPIAMAAGGALGMAGIALPQVETGIALSVLVLGALVAFSVRLPVGVAAAVVGVFAVFHGHAHGTDVSGALDPVAYALGFLLATSALHLAGVAVGQLIRWPAGRVLVRSVGASIATAGLALLVQRLA